MPARNAAPPTTPTPDAVPGPPTQSESAATFLVDLATHREAPAALGLLAAAWLWLGSQFPQSLALPPTADGWPRADMTQLHALGLDRVAGSVFVAWLLVAGAIVAAARVRQWLRVRGPIDWAGTLLALAGAVGLVGVHSASHADPALLLEMDLGAVTGPVVALQPDAGGVARATERWSGGCRAVTDAIRCDLRGPAAQGTVDLAAGSAGRLGPWTLAWLGSAPAVARGDLDLRWRGANAAASVPLVAVRLGADATVRVPSLATKLVAAAPASLGPIVVAVPAGQGPVIALGPAGLGTLAGGAAERSGRRVRVVVGATALAAHPGFGVACAGLAVAATALAMARTRRSARPRSTPAAPTALPT